ncbi:MAG: hypothetical protein ACRD8O_22960 [Bryobacteraceae bacterium]
MLTKILAVLTLSASAFAQFKMEPTGPPPSDLASGFTQDLQKEGFKITNASGAPLCEIWFRSPAPSGAKTTEDGVTLTSIPQGAYMGVIRFPAVGSDRRGQNLKPGVYTMRFSLQPVNGDHVGASPQRDFLLLVPSSIDKDAAVMPGYDDLVAMSTKASGTPHPAVLSVAKSAHTKIPDLVKEGDTDWVLHVKVGDTPVALIVVGKVEG